MTEHEIADKAIVLRVSDYREDDKIARALTAEHGVLPLILRGVKKPKAKLKFAAQPFAFFDAVFVLTKGGMYTPTDVSFEPSLFELCADMDMFSAASVCSEAVLCCTEEFAPESGLFVETLKGLSAILYDGDPYYAATCFLLNLLKLRGYENEYAPCDEPKNAAQYFGYIKHHGYQKREMTDEFNSLFALKSAAKLFSQKFDCALKSVKSLKTI